MIRPSDAHTGRARRDRTLRPRPQDKFAVARKPSEPCSCPDCGAVFRKGRWTWEAEPPEATRQRCPACARIRGKHPKATLTLRGEWFDAHREEILSLVEREARVAQDSHPLSRLMGIATDEDGTTRLEITDTHLARRLGEALSRAGGGEIAYRADRDGKHVQVVWER